MLQFWQVLPIELQHLRGLVGKAPAYQVPVAVEIQAYWALVAVGVLVWLSLVVGFLVWLALAVGVLVWLALVVGVLVWLVLAAVEIPVWWALAVVSQLSELSAVVVLEALVVVWAQACQGLVEGVLVAEGVLGPVLEAPADAAAKL